MKKMMWLCIFSLLFINPFFLKADLPGQSSSSINKPNPHPFQKSPAPKETPLPSHPRIQPLIPSAEGGVPFTLPGIVGLKDGHWVGSDNLYNLKPDISIYVELVLPENKKFDINEDQIKSSVQEIFSKAGINPTALHEPGDPSLPLFHVLLLVNSVDEYLIASCACRLFESVTIKRVILEQGITFQAITWEKQDLIIASKKDFYPLIDKTIADFSAEFVERFQYFQNLKSRQNNS